MELVALFKPLRADVRAVKHILQHDVLNPPIRLFPRPVHRCRGTRDDEHVSALAGDLPVIFYHFHVTQVDAIKTRFLKQHGSVPVNLEQFLVTIRKRRRRNHHANLKALLRFQGIRFPFRDRVQEFAHGTLDAFHVNADRGITEA